MQFEHNGYVMPRMQAWHCNMSGYSFSILLDERLNAFSASWKAHTALDKPAVFIGENIHPEANLPYFSTYDKAVKACDEVYKQLRNKN